MRLSGAVFLAAVVTLAAHAVQAADAAPGESQPKDAAVTRPKADPVDSDGAVAAPAGSSPSSPRNGPVTPADQAPAANSPEVFRPSQEISEDLSVSYPVDI